LIKNARKRSIFLSTCRITAKKGARPSYIFA
jgi:hypothetical protein